MPTYTYYCNVHKEFEIEQSIKDDLLEKCPLCINDGYVEYNCKTCDNRWSINNNSYKDAKSLDKTSTCRACFSENTEQIFTKPVRLISKSSFILRGGGWASENYSKK
jgi:hypothetical protein